MAARGSPVAGLSDSTLSPWVAIHWPSKAPGFSASMPRESRIWDTVLSVSTVIGSLLESACGTSCGPTRISHPTIPLDGPVLPSPPPRPLRRLERHVRPGDDGGRELGRPRGPGRNAPLPRLAPAGPARAGTRREAAAPGAVDLYGGVPVGVAGAPGGEDGGPPPAGLPLPARRGRPLLADRGGPAPGAPRRGPGDGGVLPLGARGLARARPGTPGAPAGAPQPPRRLARDRPAARPAP